VQPVAAIRPAVSGGYLAAAPARQRDQTSMTVCEVQEIRQCERAASDVDTALQSLAGTSRRRLRTNEQPSPMVTVIIRFCLS